MATKSPGAIVPDTSSRIIFDLSLIFFFHNWSPFYSGIVSTVIFSNEICRFFLLEEEIET